jgi:hypothetical protein
MRRENASSAPINRCGDDNQISARKRTRSRCTGTMREVPDADDDCARKRIRLCDNVAALSPKCWRR